ncbi:MAG: HAD family hydrolase [Oscillospiraceae bacterium]
MIKLIVTDLDGTLLNDKKELPQNFGEILANLKERGIAFAVASGRSYSGVEPIFKNLAQDIYFICDNGAFTVEDSRVTDIQLMTSENVHKVFDCVKALGNVDALVCGKGGTYYSYCDERMSQKMTAFYTNTTFVEDLYAIKDDIFKISVCDFHNPLVNSFPYLQSQLCDRLSVHISGDIWVDTMAMGVDKGLGLTRLQEKLGISKEETMAFGDFYNDLPMLKNAKYAFVMENAHPEMKKHATHIAKNCNENGVVKAIEEFVLHGDSHS